MTKYVWVRIKDICGDTYEYENCEMVRLIGIIFIKIPVPAGTAYKTFYKKNLISMEYLIANV